MGCGGLLGGCFTISATKAFIVRANDSGFGVRPGEGDRDSAGDVGDGGTLPEADGSSFPRFLDIIDSGETEARTSSKVTGATGALVFGRTPWMASS